MFIHHASRTIMLRVVYCGPVGVGFAETFDSIHRLLPPDNPSPIRTGFDGPIYKSAFDFAPVGLGDIQGYGLRLLVLGFETADPAATACDLSGFQDVDGVVFAVRGQTPPVYVSHAYQTLRGSLAAIGYDFATLPWAIQLEDGADPTALAQIVPIAGVPAHAIDRASGAGAFDALKAVTRAMLVAMKEDRLRVRHGENV